MINFDADKLICPKCKAKFIYISPNEEADLMLAASREAEKQAAIAEIENLESALAYRRNRIERLKLAIETNEEPRPGQKEIEDQEAAAQEIEKKISMLKQTIK